MTILIPDYGSESSIKKFHDTVAPIAKEKIEVEYIKGAYFAFGSELACLRMLYKYNLGAHNPKVRAGYSIPKQSWYFALELP